MYAPAPARQEETTARPACMRVCRKMCQLGHVDQVLRALAIPQKRERFTTFQVLPFETHCDFVY